MVKHLASLSSDRLIISFAPKTLAYSVLKRIGELFPGPSKVIPPICIVLDGGAPSPTLVPTVGKPCMQICYERKKQLSLPACKKSHGATLLVHNVMHNLKPCMSLSHGSCILYYTQSHTLQMCMVKHPGDLGRFCWPLACVLRLIADFVQS